jgi:hypothetical protein
VNVFTQPHSKENAPMNNSQMALSNGKMASLQNIQRMDDVIAACGVGGASVEASLPSCLFKRYASLLSVSILGSALPASLKA